MSPRTLPFVLGPPLFRMEEEERNEPEERGAGAQGKKKESEVNEQNPSSLPTLVVAVHRPSGPAHRDVHTPIDVVHQLPRVPTQTRPPPIRGPREIFTQNIT